MTMHIPKIYTALVTGCLFSLLAACDNEVNHEPPTNESITSIELPPIEIREGDGLPEKLPTNLIWETNEDDPVFSSPEAKRGGTYRTFMLAFPLTLRRVGPDSNGAFAGFLRYNQMSPISFHPNTRKPIPSLATHWAFGNDGRSIYYKLNPKARWSDGVPITADDFVFGVQFMRSKEIIAPWYNNYYSERIRDIKRYDDHTIGIQGADIKPREEMHASYAIGPQPKHFHRLDENWVKNYNWKIEPNTGPYQITEVSKGKYLELTRKDDWWANDLKYYRHRFNPDKVRVKVIRDINIAYQHFTKGDLDTFGLVLPQFWHEKTKSEAFTSGYIHKYWVYNDLPVPSAGMFLNMSDPLLASKNVRFGIAHAMNFEKVIKTVLRGDYERLPTFQLGFGEYDNKNIEAREFNIDKATKYFDLAGFNERDNDGIRTKNGNRLSARITYGAKHHTERLVILKEEAKKAGLEIVLQLMDASSAFKQIQEKKHQVAWMTWSSQGLSPRYWEHFHSVNANKPQTNNISNHVNPMMDELIMEYRTSSERTQRIELARRLEQMVYDSGVVIPTFQVPYTREAAWRWIKLPPWLATPTTGALFNSQALSAGMYSSGGLFWIDAAEKKRTLQAKDDGQTFAPITIVNNDHRDR